MLAKKLRLLKAKKLRKATGLTLLRAVQLARLNMNNWQKFLEQPEVGYKTSCPCCGPELVVEGPKGFAYSYEW